MNSGCLIIGFGMLLGETILCQAGKVGDDNYQDARSFQLENTSTLITYVFIATLFEGKAIDSLSMVKQWSSQRAYDVVVCCSYMSDLNR